MKITKKQNAYLKSFFILIKTVYPFVFSKGIIQNCVAAWRHVFFKNLTKQHERTCLCILTAFMMINPCYSAPLNLAQTPLYLTQSVAPLIMLVMSRDESLFYQAYNDASDLDNDGVIETTYTPSKIDYFGNFNSYTCYQYSSGVWDPAGMNTDKKCIGSNAGRWSGDFLNYLTTTRMDAIRKVLYGGLRSTDSTSDTIIERAYVPQDGHTFGKEYGGTAISGYNIAEYAPFSQPSSGRYHLFANVSLQNNQSVPRLRVAQNQPYRISDWVSIERPNAGTRVLNGSTGPSIASSITDYIVRTRVCKNGLLEANCQLYPNGKYKPIGLLQEFGENQSMKFGLLTGSYAKNLSGGVLRKNIDFITDEINATTGIFSSVNGIISTINKITVPGLDSTFTFNNNCGWISTRLITDGECTPWGNPLGEMMYETLRYFAGKITPTPQFNYSSGDDVTIGLPKPTWKDPYDPANNSACAKPNMLVISNINPSYDSDSVPGNPFNSFSGDLSPGLDSSALGQTIWNNEIGGAGEYFIGQSGSNQDGTPSAKSASSFGNIRGLTYEPSSQGSYSAASVAYYGWLNDIHPTAKGTQQVKTYAVALASQLPEIKIPVNGRTITIVPFAKSVGGCLGVVGTMGGFQPTNSLIDYYVESITPTSGSFRVSYDDQQQGADNDMDALVRYSYTVNANGSVDISVTSLYAAGCIIQHIGYVISGTTADGAYLVIRDSDTLAATDVDYFLDTPAGVKPFTTGSTAWKDNTALPLTDTRNFVPHVNSSAAGILKDPLWYAAKWGGFTDTNNNKIPDLQDEYDADHDGVPDNYFLVTNALKLRQQLSKAFSQIMDRSSSATGVSLNTNGLTNDSQLYQAAFSTKYWTGSLLAYSIDPFTGNINLSGAGPNGSQWDAATVLNNQNWDTGRQILTYNYSNQTGIPFRTSQMTSEYINMLSRDVSTGAFTNATVAGNVADFIRGKRNLEVANGGAFRNRSSVLGDIIHSQPLYVGAPAENYRDLWPGSAPENAVPYSTFRNSNKSRTKMIYVGANDGMLHAFNATTGDEKFAYIPFHAFDQLYKLTDTNYSHRYYVNGSPIESDVFINGGWQSVLVGGLGRGGQSIYALNITNPDQITESNANNSVMWEFSDANDQDMGYVYGTPTIARLNNGKWAAIFGNGYNNTGSGVTSSNPSNKYTLEASDWYKSTTGNAVIYIVDIQTGQIIKKLDTKVGMTQDPLAQARPNGMSTPLVIDRNGDGIADTIYAGDLFGNLWKVDISSSDPNAWGFAQGTSTTPAPMYVAKNDSGARQAITTAPIANRIAGGSSTIQIYFGTGKYLEPTDITDMSVQTLYAIRDSASGLPTSRSDLLAQQILSETSYTGSDGTISSVRATSDNLLTTQKGWYIDLVSPVNGSEGERVANEITLRNGKLIFTTTIPNSDPCVFGGNSWLMELDATSGRRLITPPFDLNGDGAFTDADKVTVTIGGNQVKVPVSGIKSDVGLFSAPKIMDAGNKEIKYMAGSSAGISSVTEYPGKKLNGRQSWRQLQ